MSEILPHIFAFYPLGLVAVGFALLLAAKAKNRVENAILIAASGSMVSFAFLVGPWALTSYYFRYALPVLFVIATFYRSARNKPKASAGTRWRRSSLIFLLSTLLLFVVLNVLAVAAFHQPGNPIKLTFPLTTGKYYVLQGGASIVSNPFHALAGNKLAFDIVKLNRYGNRANGVSPSALSAYEIFGERLYSPCTGTVLRLQDGVADNAPGHPDGVHPAGNHIVLKCGDAEVFLAHLKRGSIRIKAGEVVSSGQYLADIGNSGNTLEPHLHISATQGGTEIPILLDDRSLSVNSIVIR